MSVALAYIVKPFILLAVLIAIQPIRLAVQRWMKPGKLKSTLLSRI